MSDNVHGCATDAVSIRRNVFFSYFHIDRIDISKRKKKLNCHNKRLCYILISLMKVKSC